MADFTDPFLLFSYGIQFALLGFAIYFVWKAFKFFRHRQKFKHDAEAWEWAQIVLDPDGPTRPTLDDILKRRHLLRKGQK